MDGAPPVVALLVQVEALPLAVGTTVRVSRSGLPPCFLIFSRKNSVTPWMFSIMSRGEGNTKWLMRWRTSRRSGAWRRKVSLMWPVVTWVACTSWGRPKAARSSGVTVRFVPCWSGFLSACDFYWDFTEA